MNSYVRMQLRDSLSTDTPPAGVLPEMIPVGSKHTCDHTTSVCDKCLGTWAIDYWVDLTVGLINTFIIRYGRFPKEVLDTDGVHFRVPETRSGSAWDLLNDIA